MERKNPSPKISQISLSTDFHFPRQQSEAKKKTKMARRLARAASQIVAGNAIASRSFGSIVPLRSGMGMPIGKHLIPDKPAGYSSPTQAAITEDLSLSTTEYSMFGSILTFGAMIGAITSGPIADLVGRKGALRVSTAVCVAGWLAIFAKGALSLDIGRVATGYGMGVFSYVVPVFIAEIAPKELRGALTAANQLMIVSGVSVSFIIGTVVTWRALALIGLVPCAVVLIQAKGNCGYVRLFIVCGIGLVVWRIELLCGIGITGCLE